jgi:hypothetical protein
MGILKTLLDEIKSNDLTQQVREICDKIFEEEKDRIKNIDYIITGPNVFLCLDVPGRNQNEVAFLSLEREYEETYLAVLWTWRKNQLENNTPDEIDPPKKRGTWVFEENQAPKILTEYAKIVKHLKGEFDGTKGNTN